MTTICSRYHTKFKVPNSLHHRLNNKPRKDTIWIISVYVALYYQPLPQQLGAYCKFDSIRNILCILIVYFTGSHTVSRWLCLFTMFIAGRCTRQEGVGIEGEDLSY